LRCSPVAPLWKWRATVWHRAAPGLPEFVAGYHGLGIGFLLGQLVAWRQLVAEGIYLASNPPAASFTFSPVRTRCICLEASPPRLHSEAEFRSGAGDALRCGGSGFLLLHFMDALWLFLLALLYLGK